METSTFNFILFVPTVCFWFVVWAAYSKYKNGSGMESGKIGLKRLLIISLLSTPFNINDNIYTFIGNAESTKNIYSVSSFYQKAEKDAMSLLSAFAYQGSKGTTFTFFGIVNCQKGQTSITAMSLFTTQEGDKSCIVAVGVPVSQQSKDKSYLTVGIMAFQEGKICKTPVAFTFHQKEDGKNKSFCIFGGL